MLTAPGPSSAQPWVSLDPARHGEPWVRELVASACGGTVRGTGLGDATAWWHVSPCPRVLSIHPSGKHEAGGVREVLWCPSAGTAFFQVPQRLFGCLCLSVIPRAVKSPGRESLLSRHHAY